MRNWLLPEYIEDVLPPAAGAMETARRGLLDLFAAHGYALVAPPLLEYVESLLTGSGRDLDLKTFKLVDQLSGRTLGVRADITPQVARIDAHLLGRKGVNRLCYAGSVLHTLPAPGDRTREPLQVGAEIYGHAGIEADLEVQRLLIEALAGAGVRRPHLDIGHVGVFRALVKRAGIAAEAEADLFRAVQAKDQPGLAALTRRLAPGLRAAFARLPELVGGEPVLKAAARALPADAGVRRALAQLRAVAAGLRGSGADVRFDLGELRGYHYHSGIVFAAYAEGWSNALALGGRYDEVGKAYGRARAATGFSLDLRELLTALPPPRARASILAPYRPRDAALQKKVAALRAAGRSVVMDLPGHAASRGELGCAERLVKRDGAWRIAKA